MAARILVPALLISLLASSSVFAQGILIDPRPEIDWRLPRPVPQPEPSSYKIKELAIDATLIDQIAQVQVTQTFVNTGSVQMEVVFIFPLPHDGAVDGLTFLVDGTEFEAEILDAAEARQIYEGYMRKNLDPALMEWMGWGMFKTSVFPVPAGAERTVQLRYSQICRKERGLTELLFPLGTAKFSSTQVEHVRFRVNIQSQAAIRNVYSPTHEIDVERPSNDQAIVQFHSTDDVPTNDFRLFYDVGDAAVGATVLSYRPEGDEDGYFVMLVNPSIPEADKASPCKTVMLVVDRSGSMSGEKIEQARGALRYVVNNLSEGDRFNIIAYDSRVESFRPEIQTINDETRQAALGFINGLYAGGSTNIDGALDTALTQLKGNDQPNFVIFLTDGRPTHGERGEMQIVANTEEYNDVKARLFCFGVGFDVNSRLLDRLARANFGQSNLVRPEEDIEAQVTTLYDRIGSPVLTDVAIDVDLEGASVAGGAAISRVYPRNIYDLFAGEQLVVVGRYRASGTARVRIHGYVAGEEETLDFPAELVAESRDESYSFVQKLWAVRRIAEIIDEIDLSGQNQELIDELVALSKRHGIITPYTSFLADDQPNVGPGGRPIPMPVAELRAAAGRELDDLSEAAGQNAFDLRNANDALQGANAPSEDAARFFASGEGEEHEEMRARIAERVLNIGAKTFFLRGDQWIESSLTEEEIESAQSIERFDTAYFDLAETLGRDGATYLAIEGKVIVKLGEGVYSY